MKRQDDNIMYDVIVCGGGVAGVSAALAASRNNARVLLIEREYMLGGLATLGLIAIYLPLCDGNGNKMSSGISEELLKLSFKYGPGDVPKAWLKNGTANERKKNRYLTKFNPSSFAIAMEEELIKNKVKILYGCHISGVELENNKIKSILVETKTGKKNIYGKTFVDATGDADICYFAGEKTVTDETNRKTGWYFSYDTKQLELNMLSDPLYDESVDEKYMYSGTDMESISQSLIDGRKMILNDVLNKRKLNENIYPLIIPAFHGLRMTRRFKGKFEFSADDNENQYFEDSIGMIGNWRKSGLRYSLPLRIIEGIKNKNLYIAGRCVSTDKSGWDVTRVIPSCAVTGEAAGTIAAYQSITGQKPNIEKLQKILVKNGVLLDKSLFL